MLETESLRLLLVMLFLPYQGQIDEFCVWGHCL